MDQNHGAVYSVLRSFLVLHDPVQLKARSWISSIWRSVVYLLKVTYWSLVFIFIGILDYILLINTFSSSGGLSIFLEHSKYIIKSNISLVILVTFHFRQQAFYTAYQAKINPQSSEMPGLKMVKVEKVMLSCYALLKCLEHILTLVEYLNADLTLTTKVPYFTVIGISLSLPLWVWDAALAVPLAEVPKMLGDLVIICFSLHIYRTMLDVQSVKRYIERDALKLDESTKAMLLDIRESVSRGERTFSLIVLLHCVAHAISILGHIQGFKTVATGSVLTAVPLLLMLCLAVMLFVPLMFVIRFRDKLDSLLDDLWLHLHKVSCRLTQHRFVEAESFIRTIRTMIPQYTAGKFFLIDRNFVAALLGFFATYALVMKELLKDSETGYGHQNASHKV